MPEPVAVAVTAATVTFVKAGYDVVVPIVTKRFNGRAYTKEGGKLMDETMRILDDPALSKGMTPSTTIRFLREHQALQPKRQALERSTATMVGSIIHSPDARRFHSQAKILRDDTKSNSHTAWVNDQLMIANMRARKRSHHVGSPKRVIHIPQRSTGNPGEVEIQAQERPSQRAEGHLQNDPAQEFELKIVDVQDPVYAQGQPASHKRGDSGPDTSEAEARLRAILSPGGKKF